MKIVSIENIHDYRLYLDLLMANHPIENDQQKENKRIMIELMVSGFDDGVKMMSLEGLKIDLDEIDAKE